MQYSGNGWPGIEERADLKRSQVPGTDLFILTAPDAAWILQHFAAEFHRRIESLTGGQLDDWSYAWRPVRGSKSTLSCHASGTALDLNALRHSRGVRGTFSAKDKAELRRLLAEFEDPNNGISVINWGGDWTPPSIVDEMHFQIRGDKAALKRVRSKLEDLVTPKDKEDIINGVFEKIKTEKFISNKPTSFDLERDPNAVAGSFSIGSALANIETDVDRHYEQLNARLDEILAALKPANTAK